MRYSLTLMRVTAIGILLCLILTAMKAQPHIPEGNRKSFVNYVLSDARLEPNALVFKLKTTDYCGYVIDFDFYYEMMFEEYFASEFENTWDSLLNLIVNRQTIFLNRSISEFRSTFVFPPQDHRFYRYLRKSPRKLIEKYFVRETTTGNYYMISTLNREDQLALIVVLFEHQIPIYENGWGMWIDTNIENENSQ